jgi:RNA polymerase sigma-70 factor, ECF subfamily
MIVASAYTHQRDEPSTSASPSNHEKRNQTGAHGCPAGARPDGAQHDLHDRMVKLLPRLRRFMGSLTKGAEVGEDLIQDTYLRALTHLDQWQPGTRLDSWMFRIAQNLWIDHKRAEKVRGDVVDLEFVDQTLNVDGQAVAETRLAFQALKEGIAKLSIEQRSVIRLVCEYGLSYKEAGRILNLPPGTVMSRLARARNMLQNVI